MTIFGSFERTDPSPARHGESLHAFLNRCSDPFFAAVRHTLEDWLGRVPLEHRRGLIGSFASARSNEAFMSAFWELYLHEMYLQCGYKVTIHPPLASTSKRPDFLVEGHGARFYVEAVQVGTSQADVAEARRLTDVHAVLDTERTDRFSLSLSYEEVGAQPLATTGLRKALQEWLSGLDADALVEDLTQPETPGEIAFDRLPRLDWAADDWRLHFHAIPLKPGLPEGSTPLIGMHGPASAQVIDKHTGIMRALDGKAKRYGKPDAPLVIALLDNTGPIGTHGYNVEQALYGLSAARPAANPDLSGLIRDGHWLTRHGWRRGHAPQVVTAVQFNPWNAADYHPQLWETLEPGHIAPAQPDFLARMNLTTPDPMPLPAGGNPFGLPVGWPGPPPFAAAPSSDPDA